MDPVTPVDDNLVFTILRSPEFAAFLFASLTAAGAWVARTVVRLLRNRLNEEQLRVLFRVAEQAVRVVEQTNAKEASEAKKAAALKVAQTYLDAYGIRVSAAQLDAAIEAAVWSVITKFKPPVPEDRADEPGEG